MSALRKPVRDTLPKPTQSPAPVDAFDPGVPVGGASPALMLQEQVRSVFSIDTHPADPRYPVAVRAAIIVGASVGLWSMIGAVVFAVL